MRPGRRRVTPVLLALASAALFGAMTRRDPGRARARSERRAATLATLVVAFAVTLAGSLVRHDYTNAWKFFLAGLLAPGLSQILFTRSIREVGASRTSVTVGTAPLFALAIAFLFLDEPVAHAGRDRRGSRSSPAASCSSASATGPTTCARAGSSSRSARPSSSRCATTSSARSTRTAARRPWRAATMLAGVAVVARSRRGACRRAAIAAPARAGGDPLRAARTSASSRRTSAAGSRSSRRSSRPSRSGASGSPRSSSEHRGGRAAGRARRGRDRRRRRPDRARRHPIRSAITEA